MKERKLKKNFNSYSTNEQNHIPQSKLFLIICEGKNTETSYFKKFKSDNLKVVPIGVGRQSLELVEEAIIKRKEEARKLELKGETFDEVWCVFDVDPNPKNTTQIKDFNAALGLAKKNGFKVAYSNQAFEYWLILHFEDHQGGKMHRSIYNDKINAYLKPLNSVFDGKGSKQISDDFFEIMLELDPKTKKSRQEMAIARAEHILNFHRQNQNLPYQAESSTTVHQLVALLAQNF